MKELYAELKAELQDRFRTPVTDITYETSLKDLGLDSLALLDLLFGLEEKYGVEVDMNAAELNTVGDVLRLFEAAIAARPSAGNGPA